MSGLAELAAVMMNAGQGRIEMVAGNVSNMTTPGYRATRAFQQIVDQRDAIPALTMREPTDSGQPALKSTGNSLDIALSGRATLLLRSGRGLTASQSAQLRRGGEGRLIDSRGRALQASGGGDIIIGPGEVSILKDGIILVAGQPAGRIGFFDPDGAASGDPLAEAEFSASHNSLAEGLLYQGMIVPSNVDLSAEMVELTQAGRMAETGARVFQIYDELLGRLTTKLGGNS